MPLIQTHASSNSNNGFFEACPELVEGRSPEEKLGVGLSPPERAFSVRAGAVSTPRFGVAWDAAAIPNACPERSRRAARSAYPVLSFRGTRNLITQPIETLPSSAKQIGPKQSVCSMNEIASFLAMTFYLGSKHSSYSFFIRNSYQP